MIVAINILIGGTLAFWIYFMTQGLREAHKDLERQRGVMTK